MTTQRSLFTEAIEDHLALKKQNSVLEAGMPLARFDVGDPLDRYPGGPVREDASIVTVSEAVAAGDVAVSAEPMVGPTPEQALEAAHSLDTTYAGPIGGMTPMLSLVEDLDDEEDDATATNGATELFGASIDAAQSAHVLRFPGGVGPREEAAPAATPASVGLLDDAHAAATGEQPVIVVDADEPFSASEVDRPAARQPHSRESRRPRFFGLGKRKKSEDAPTDGWFTDGPRDFDWS